MLYTNMKIAHQVPSNDHMPLKNPKCFLLELMPRSLSFTSWVLIHCSRVTNQSMDWGLGCELH